MISSTFSRLASSSLRAAPHHSGARRHERCIRMWRPVSRLSTTVHLREQLDVLERAGDAEVGDLVGSQAHHRCALEADVAAAAARTPG